jgi:4-hydroxybenzoate polyprenyltransferase
LVLALSKIIKRSVIQTAHVFSFFFPVIFIAPILDIYFSGGLGTQMTYLHPQEWQQAWDGFVRFMQSDDFGQGATIGLTVEVAIIICGMFVFALAATGNLFRALVASTTTYVVIYLYAIFPLIAFSFFEAIEIPNDMSFSVFNRTAIFMLLLMLIVQSFIIGFLAYRNQMILFIRDIRFLRILHYVAIFLLGGGFVLYRYRAPMNSVLLLQLLLIFVAFVMVVIHAIVTNNIEDVEIDKVSNPNRPLAKGTMSLESYEKVGNIMLILGLLVGYITGFYNFFFLFCFAGCYYLYSCSPFRIKRAPLLSKMFLGCISLCMFIWGFLFFSNDGVLSLSRFPVEMVLFFVLIGGFVGNYIDLKDMEGDKKAGIMTLPVLLGLNKTKLLVSLGGVLAFTFLYFVFDIPVLLYGMPVGLVVYLVLLNKKPYREMPFLAFYVSMLFAGAALMFLKNSPNSEYFELLVP